MKEYKRICPRCQQEIVYKSSASYCTARKNNSTCLHCRKEKLKGEGNPFFGKTHTPDTIQRIKASDHSYKRSGRYRETMRKAMLGNKNGGDIRKKWAEKYSPEEAKQKIKEWSRKKSEKSKGKNNPMFGKPAPQGAGNGWSGWYKGWFFRSICELSYLINEIEKNNREWRTAETNDLAVEYADDSGQIRTYFADFVVDNRLLVECKPKRLWNSPKVRAKAEAAQRKAKELGLEYVIVDPERLTFGEIRSLYESGQIVFIDRYKQLYEERYGER